MSRSDLKTSGGAVGIGGTASADFGAAGFDSRITVGTLSMGGDALTDSSVARSRLRAGDGEVGIGGSTSSALGDMPFVKRASAGTLGTGGRAVTISSTDRSDLRARSGADGVGGTASADFGSSRALPLITAGTLGAGGVTTEGSNVSRSDLRTGGGAAGIGGVTTLELGASGWLFVAGLFPALAGAGRPASPLEPSSMMRLFPTELRLTTSLLAAAARSLFCVDLGSDLSSTISRAPAPAVSLLTAMTGPRLTTKR